MQKTNRHLLSTRPLPKSLIEEAATQGVIIDELSFIQTTPIQDEAVTQRINELASQEITVVFTSMNAVEAIADQLKTVPYWKVYSIGNTTRKLIEEKLPASQLVATADNAERLGVQLIDDGVRAMVFFCGNIRRDELPNKFRSEGGTVEELVVYKTIETPSPLDKEYDGILFFSPSAVQSFFGANTISTKTHLFAIGKTTAEAIRQHQNRKIIISRTTDKVEMAREAISFLANQN
jgi:uroporphyrinogen-III synthase